MNRQDVRRAATGPASSRPPAKPSSDRHPSGATRTTILMVFEAMSPQLRNYHADRIEREWYDRLTPEAKPLHGPGRLLIVSPTHFETT